MPVLAGKTPEQWREAVPVFDAIARGQNAFWLNDALPLTSVSTGRAVADSGFSRAEVDDAALRLDRFKPYIASAFPETAAAGGLIESPLHRADALRHAMQNAILPNTHAALGPLYLKLDSHLPISGSIKARGGIYEILLHAEQLAMRHGLLKESDDYALFDTPAFRQFFSGYSIAVGSTGNLGLSIGIISAKLGFNVTVHMSSDARKWKKDLLRAKGARVVEYADDYSAAVKAGREAAARDPDCHFVDDEDSRALFLGYTVAGRRVAAQLAQAGVVVDARHPMCVYLPCGVGGGPSGVAFGLKLEFGKHVHCFFAEPAQAPAMILGLASGLDDRISSEFFGLGTRTVADGLAVGRASGLACKAMRHMLDGCFTMQDEELFRSVALVADTENIRLEPSAVAGLSGISRVSSLFAERVPPGDITHLAWATGGGMVPPEEWETYYTAGKQSSNKHGGDNAHT